MGYYMRVGNRTVTRQEMQFMKPAQIEEIKAQGEAANQKRLENMRKGLGLEPKKLTLDVTPAGVAARKSAIEAEEAKIAAETVAVAEEIGPEITTFVAEAEAPAEIKKPKGSKKAS